MYKHMILMSGYKIETKTKFFLDIENVNVRDLFLVDGMLMVTPSMGVTFRDL